MRFPALLSVLALAAVALSGCSDAEPGLKEWQDEQEQTDALDTGDLDAGDAGNETEDEDDNGTVAPNAAPTANLTASAVNGTAPLNVTFTLDGADADGDALAWTFTVGNVTQNGTALPASVNATLEAGNWTATLSVSDGVNETVATQVVAVGSGTIAPADPFAVVTAAWDVGATDGPGIPDYFFCSAGPYEGVTHATVGLPDGVGGRTFTASLTAATGLESVAEWGFFLFSAAACDGAEDQLYSESLAPVGGGVTGTITGTVPAAADMIIAFSSGGALLELELVIE